MFSPFRKKSSEVFSPVSSLRGLERVELSYEPLRVPERVRRFQEDAEQQVRQFRQEAGRQVPEFVSSAPLAAYHALVTLRQQRLTAGLTFCEWGSGLGVVAGLAALAGFQARGIEIDERLVAASRRLLENHGLDVPIVAGSYKPVGIYSGKVELVDGQPRFDPPLDFHPARFDVLYAYPWPAEERAVFEIFRRYAPATSLLVTYHGGRDLRVHRKS